MREFINVALVAADEAMLLKAVRVSGVFPASLKDQPPMEIHVCRFGARDLIPVKRE